LWDLLLQSLAEPAVIRRVRVGAHEGVFDDIIALIDLAMSFALIVIPNATALAGEDGPDREQGRHLPRLEDAALRIDQWDALALELEAASKIMGTDDTAVQGGGELFGALSFAGGLPAAVIGACARPAPIHRSRGTAA
jgi:hypothetical protein